MREGAAPKVCRLSIGFLGDWLHPPAVESPFAGPAAAEAHQNGT